MRSAYYTTDEILGLGLQRGSLEDLVVRCLRSIGGVSLRYARLMVTAAAILALPATSVCALVFALSIFMRDGDPTRGLPSNDPLLLAVAMPAVGSPEAAKSARLPVSASSRRLTTDAILAAYRRTVVSRYAQQNIAALFAMATDTDAPSAADVEAALIPVSPIVADAEKPLPLPIPAEKPAFDWRPAKPVIAKNAPQPAETAKAAPPAPGQLASLSEPTQPQVPPAAGYVGPLSRRTGPDAGTKTGFPWSARSSRAAIYDISAGVVYLPDGERLEAHSGVGRMRDNPNFVHVKMLGPTPPATYALSLREASFHGVEAIRLTPVNGNAPYGREGLLAHTYMLRRPGDSNGCVVFADYNRFLKAFRNNEINYITVVPHIEDRMTWVGLGRMWG